MRLLKRNEYYKLMIFIALVVAVFSFLIYTIVVHGNNRHIIGGNGNERLTAFETPPDTGKAPTNIYVIDRWLFWLILSIAFSSAVIAVFLAYNIIIRVKIENELRDSRERYIKAFTLSPEAMIVHSYGIIVMANKAAAEILGVTNPKELEGNAFFRLIKKTRQIKLMSDNNINMDNCHVYEYEIEKKNGNHVTVLSTTVPFPYKGKKMKLSVLKDMTAHYMLQETVELDKLKSRFFSNLSHELRTPLNVIMSTLQLLGLYTRKFPEKIEPMLVSDKIDIMNRNCYRLLRLISNLIDITRLNTGNYTLNLENRDIVKIVRNITLSAAELAEQNDITLLFHTDIKEKVISCDQDVVERIILNLLSNAIKFSREKCLISVRLYGQGNVVKISVKDNGIGIPKHIKDYVFGEFFHVDDSFTRQAEGSGIGLSLVKSLVEMHKGTITVITGEGEGSEFIVTLPADEVPNRDEADVIEFNRENCLEKVLVEFSDLFHVVRNFDK